MQRFLMLKKMSEIRTKKKVEIKNPRIVSKKNNWSKNFAWIEEAYYTKLAI